MKRDLICCLEACNGLVFAGYTVGYFAYVGIGGLMFMIIEGGVENSINELPSKLQIVKETVIRKFPEVTGEALDDFVSELSSAGVGNFPPLNVTEPKWSFSQSVFFCMTLLTTIGYGHVAPVSQVGKAVCMIYTSIGIPLTIIFVAAYVQRVIGGTRAIQKALVSGCHRYFFKPLTIRILVFIMAFVIVGILFFLVPAAIFSRVENNWTYLDALYFCFISLTTVGLGDYVPGKNADVAYKALYRFGASIYLLIGVMSLTFLMALATQCQECILHRQAKVGKAPTKPPLSQESRLPSYGAIVQETVVYQEPKNNRMKHAYR